MRNTAICFIPSCSQGMKKAAIQNELRRSAAVGPLSPAIRRLGQWRRVEQAFLLEKRKVINNLVNFNRLHIVLGLAALPDGILDAFYCTHIHSFLSWAFVYE